MVTVNAKTKKVKFEVSVPKAGSVSLLGDFNGWNEEANPMKKGKGGNWTMEVALAEGDHNFLYRADRNQWIHDDSSVRVINAFGTENCVVTVKWPGKSAKPKAASKPKKK